MFRFLGRLASPKVQAVDETENQRFTRFQTPEERNALRCKYTRNKPVPVKPPTAEIVPLPRIERPPEPVEPQKLDENAHLHSCGDVSVSVLKKALPERFAKAAQPNKKVLV